MAGQKRTITGLFRDDIDPPGTTTGTGYRIGDGYTLTAGHVVFEWNRSRTNPQILDGSNTISLDYRGYRSAYLGAVNQLIATTPPGGTIPPNGTIEARLISDDSVVITGGGSIGASADGLVVFLSASDLTAPTGVLSGASVLRDGNVTGLVSGNISAASGGRLTFLPASMPGDSGGAYLLRFDARDYVIGTQSAQQGHFTPGGVFVPTGNAFGTYFTYGEWTSINNHIASGSGDVTDNDPTNMIVGSGSGDGATGSFRADIILGLGGDDILQDGDTLGTGRYARDQMFGGTGNDKFYAYSGKDLLHGGDHRLSASVSALDDDGIDEAHYEAHAAGIKLKLLAADATLPWTHAYTANAVWVEELGGTKVNDSLVSIEKVFGSNATDTIQVDELRAAIVAGADGKGGLLEVDLGAHPDGEDKGDHIDATNMKAAIKIDLAAGRVEIKGTAAVGFNVKNAERITGGEGDDELTGNDQKNTIIGGKGKDTIKGGAGEDKIEGGEGDDTLEGGAENDKLDGGADNDTLVGGAGEDELRGGEGTDTIDGEKDDGAGDQLYGGGGGDTFKTNNGDVIHDIGGGDSVSLGGRRLVGGERELPPEDPCATPSQDEDEDEIESDTYRGRDGTTYVYSKESATLQVSAPGGTITILDWTNGEGGIRLRNERPPVEQAECNRDPLILDLNNDKSVVAELYDVNVYFDIDNDGIQERMAWALPQDGLLAMDRNGDGRITNGGELFGTGTILARANGTVTVGTSGFSDLSELDSNFDRVIDSSDASFAALRIWQDVNSDGITDDGELKSLQDIGLASISLRTRSSDDLDCGCDGTRVVSMSDALRIDGSKLGVYDAFLAVDNFDTIHTDLPPIPDEIAGLPFLLGSGDVADLHSAMARDPLLQEMVEQLVRLGPQAAGDIPGHVERLILRWTGADAAAVDGRGAYVNGQWLAAIEALYGSGFRQNGTNPDPRPDAASDIVGAWRELVDLATAQLIGQMPLGQQLFPGLSFEAGAFFVLEQGSNIDTLLAAFAAAAPETAAERVAHWHTGLATLAAAAAEFGLSVSQVDAAAAPWLEAAGIMLSAGEIRRLIVGGDAGQVSGTHAFRDRPGADTIYSLAEQAVLSGGSGDDRYLVRQGQHVAIDDIQGNDELWLPDLVSGDVRVSFVAYDGAYTLLVRSNDGATSATASGSYAGGTLNPPFERIRFGDGTVVEVGESVAQSSLATDGTDIIAAHPVEGTLLDGQGGDDYLLGYAGDDSYVVGPGRGSDQVVERGGSAGDVLLIDAPLAAVSFEASADPAARDLLVKFAGSTDVVVLRGQRLSGDSVIETFRFADGQTLSAEAVEAALVTGGSGNDRLIGGFRDDLLDGKQGDDLLTGGAGLDTYVIGLDGGHDVVRDEGMSWVSFAGEIEFADLELRRGGERLADLLVEIGSGAASLLVEGQMVANRIAGFRFADGTTLGWEQLLAHVEPAQGGEIRGTTQDDNDQRGTVGTDIHLPGRGNDYTYDPGGDDIYHFNYGDGKDGFYDGIGNDVLVFGRGIVLEDIHWSRDGSDLILSIGSDQVRLASYYYSGTTNHIETIRFHDGSTFALGSLASVHEGTAGNDYLFDLSEYPNRYPYYGSVSFRPGAGDDIIKGSLSRDTIYLEAGFGHDTILDDGAQLYSHPGIDLEFGAGLDPAKLRGRREGNDLILYFEGAPDELRLVDRYADPDDSPYFGSIHFASGTWTYGSNIERIVLAATPGDDDIRYGPIVNNVEQNIRDGGAGNDILRGWSGSLYPFAVGYGHDTIINRAGAGTVRFDNLAMGDVAFSRSVNNPLDLVATIRTTGETLTITSHHLYSGRPERNDPIAQFRFTDGTLTHQQVLKLIHDREIAEGVTTFVSPGDRVPLTLSGADETILVGSDGVQLVIGANSGRDKLAHWNDEDMESIYLKMADILPGQLSAALFYDIQGAEPGWRLAIGSGPTSLLIVEDLARMYDEWGPVSSWDIEVSFVQSTQRMYSNHIAALVTGSLGSGTAAALGVEQIEAIFGTPQDDVLQGGAGDEILAGGEGDDIYLFGPDTGHDIIAESTYAIDWGWEGEDAIRVREWNADQVTFSWGDLLNGQIVLHGPGDVSSITFSSYDLDEYLGAVAFVQFADGSRLSTEEIVADLLSSTGPGEEVVQGDWDRNELDGRGGNDVLAGGPDEDVYVFGRGYGDDRIVELHKWNDGYWDANHVRFLQGVTAADLIFTRGGDGFKDLIVTIKGDAGSLTIIDQFEDWRPVHEFRFADGSKLSWQQVHDRAAGLDLSGDNVIETDSGGGVLDGGAGFDELRGGTGDDIYMIGRGNDEDRIVDAGGAQDIVRFKEGVGPADVVFSRSPDDPGDLLIEVTGLERLSLNVEGQLAAAAAEIEFFEFPDGTRISARDVERMIIADETTSGSDGVSGFRGDDRIEAGAGNDIVTGGQGDDFIDGGAGRDVAIFSGSREDYELVFENGRVLVHDLRSAGDGTDTLVQVEDLQFLGEGPGAPLLNLAPANAAPVAAPDGATMAEDGTLILPAAALLGNDVDSAGEVLRILRVFSVTSGQAWIGLDGAIRYRPPADFNGIATFSYEVADTQGARATSRVTIVVRGANDAPVFPGAAVTIDEDGATGPFLGQDIDGDALGYAVARAPAHGTLLLDPSTGGYRYVPHSDFAGVDRFSIDALDGAGGRATSEISVTVNAINDAPVAAGMELVLSAGSQAVGRVAAVDVDDDFLTYEIGSAPLAGALTIDRSTGAFTYVAAEGVLGEEVAEIIVSDAAGTSTVVALHFTLVEATSRPPVLAAPLQDVHVLEDAAVAFAVPQGTFADPDGDILLLRAAMQDGSPLPDWLAFDGQGFTGTPPIDFHGALALRVHASDGADEIHSDFRLVVAPVNDAPVLGGRLADVQAIEDVPFDLPLEMSRFADADGEPLSFSLEIAGGGLVPEWLRLDGARLVGSPPADQNGSIALRVIASDGLATTSGEFILHIQAVNDLPQTRAPLADVSSNEDQPIDFALPAGSFVDVDGDMLALTARRADGSALPDWLSFENGHFQGLPPANHHGDIDIVVKATDGTSTVSSGFRLSIKPVNDAPVLLAPLVDRSGVEDQPIDFALASGIFSDPDGDALLLSARLASGGELPSWLEFAHGRFTGAPPADYNGRLEILVRASDGSMAANAGFAISISPVNDRPQAVHDETFLVVGGQALTILPAVLLENDVDVDGDSIAVTGVTAGLRGAVSINPLGEIVYTPEFGFAGSDSFQYTISDGVLTSTASVSVVVSNPFAQWQNGTDGRDNLKGNMSSPNQIFAAGGDDHVRGGKLEDQLAGGAGDDHLLGLQGRDSLYGMSGDDQLNGGPDQDTAFFSGFSSTYVLTTSDGRLFVEDIDAIANGDDGTDSLVGVEHLSFRGGQLVSVAAPIILDLDGDGIELLSAAESRARFDMDGDGKRDDTSWFEAGDGLLFVDLNGDGTLSSASEFTFADALPNAASDLAGLRAYDSDVDGRISDGDASFRQFRVWQDADGNGKVGKNEVMSLERAGVESIGLDGTAASGRSSLGSGAILNVGSFETTNGGAGLLADVAFTYFSEAKHGGRGRGEEWLLDGLEARQPFGGRGVGAAEGADFWTLAAGLQSEWKLGSLSPAMEVHF